MSSPLQDQVKRLVSQPAIHDAWETAYRTAGIERLWERIYDDFVARIGQPPGSHAIDIGCGPGYNAMRLARRGYRVTAVDYSEAILPLARENVAHEHLSDVITIGRDDILNLSYPSQNFDLVLCQGILMHVPDLTQAVAEVARVARPGGYIVLEELNQGSPESWAMRTAWSLFKSNIKITRTPAGHECTCIFEGETAFWRQTNAQWLTGQFAEHSCELVRRDSSMFTEIWQYTPGRFLKGIVHAWNLMWVRRLNLPRLAYHNLFIFRKKEQSP
jgi:ubiquinone/menaquinone biosynthesis C-methylase UbiE